MPHTKWDRMYGPVFLEEGWVPSPSYLLRRWILFSLLKPFPRGRVLEVGSASGAMLLDLTELGFRTVGVETSEKAFDISGRILREKKDVVIHRFIPRDERKSFDYVMALEVLEHMDDDGEALIQWRKLLKDGGKLVLSVPARRDKWSSSDIWAGHYRRYERTGLVSLLSRAGFETERILSYGFPIKNLTDVVRRVYHSRLVKKADSADPYDRRAATAESGIYRKLERKLFPLYCNRMSSLFFHFAFRFQSFFYGTDLGNGYIVVAGKKALDNREMTAP